MYRSHFLKTALLAGIGAQFQIKENMLTSVFQQNVKIKHLLGVDTSHLFSQSIQLEEKTYRSFLKMKSAAANAGIDLKIVSGYRSYERQKTIWEQKFKQWSKNNSPAEAISAIIAYSSIPGTSRHHWGTDIDLIDGAASLTEGDLLLEENYHGKGNFSNLLSWMQSNAESFGFYLVYTKDEKRPGFKYEPWHYSYAPTSKTYLKLQTSKAYLQAWNSLSFLGKSEMTKDFIDSYFQNYSLGIHPALMPS